MKRVFLAVLLLCSCAVAQDVTWNATATSQFVWANPDANVTIYTTGDLLITVDDAKGTRLVTVFKDGRVEAKDPSKLDEAAKTFWASMAKFRGVQCVDAPKIVEAPAVSR